MTADEMSKTAANP